MKYSYSAGYPGNQRNLLTTNKNIQFWTECQRDLHVKMRFSVGYFQGFSEGMKAFCRNIVFSIEQT